MQLQDIEQAQAMGWFIDADAEQALSMSRTSYPAGIAALDAPGGLAVPQTCPEMLFRFYWDFGKLGALHGLFVATSAQVAKSYGKFVQFDKALGAQFDAAGVLEQKDISMVSSNPAFVAQIKATIGASFGHNPLRHLSD